MTSSGRILTDVDGAVGRAVISNPPRRNAISTAMMADLADAVRSLDADPGVRVVVLRGDGDVAFAAGADISEFEGRQASDDARASADATTAALFSTLEDLATPLVAQIGGFCLGAGLALALAADLRVAAEGSSFSIPAARLGIGYPPDLAAAIVRLVGPAHAADLLYTARRVPADEALAMGLVNRVVPAADLQAAVDEVTAAITANAPLSVRASKSSIRAAAHPLDPARARRAADDVAACAASEDVREGGRAFLERRAPRFTGR